VVINGRYFESAWGVNKKSAEQKAARNALYELEVLKSEKDSD
jgi:dsRNA-specific ribonuclease